VTANTRLPGLSFVIRARNEAEALFDNFVSLRGVKVPHEIVLILHRCTDESKQVAEAWIDRGLPIRVIEDETPISRAGYETLVTPVTHPNSLPEFYNRSFNHARYQWLLKWDADFVATEYFLDFINNKLDISLQAPTTYRLQCELGKDAICREDYMFNAWVWYGKYYFWEYCRQREPRETITIFEPCILSCSPKVIKTYWHEKPWFLQPDTHDAVLADKYAKLCEILGPEPPGLARTNNPDFDAYWARLLAMTPTLEQYGIFASR
jgi:glycosyltransferase involved in cell wall biosynthesis